MRTLDLGSNYNILADRKLNGSPVFSFGQASTDLLFVLFASECRLKSVRFVLEQAVHRPLTLFIEEFQDFLKIDESIINDIAGDWDEFHGKSKINLIVCGSINRLMGEIFEDKEAPLYGRKTASFRIEPFRVSATRQCVSTAALFFKNRMKNCGAFPAGILRKLDSAP